MKESLQDIHEAAEQQRTSREEWVQHIQKSYYTYQQELIRERKNLVENMQQLERLRSADEKVIQAIKKNKETVKQIEHTLCMEPGADKKMD